MPDKDKVVSVKVEIPMFKLLEKEAKDTDLSISQIVRRLIRNHYGAKNVNPTRER